MFKIPNDNKKFLKSNKSDLLGNITTTKNINFDEEGYIKLSDRAVSLYSSLVSSDFSTPSSFGRYSGGSFYLATTKNPYIVNISDTVCLLSKDTDSDQDAPPTMSTSTNGIWWRNLWHTTTSTKLYHKTVSTGNWVDTTVSLTTGVIHPLCSFIKANTLLVGDANTVKQLNSSYATTSLAQLTLPTGYEVVSIAYNNNQVAVATRLSSTVEGQNQEAQLFIWDGSESSANSSYGVGSDACLIVFPYKSSFGLITRTGEILYFNGGGFEKLDSFPVYYKEMVWGDFLNVMSYGDTVKVDGELIYININSNITDNKLESFDENMLGGIWCYDPNVGLYHRMSPSVSQATDIYCQTSDINITTNIFTRTSFDFGSSIPETGNPIKLLRGSIGGLTTGTIYYIIKVSATEFKLADTYANALASTEIDITSAVDCYFLAITLKDYGAVDTNRPGGLALFGSKSNIFDKFIFGGEYNDLTTTGDYEHLNISVNGFKNIGYFITPKLYSKDTEDNFQKLFLKYKPLDSNSQIVIKYKDKEFITLPEYASCTVVSSTIITTTADIADSFAFTDELECEILSGSGAGQMPKVSSISYNAGTYTITFDSAIDGFTANDICFIKLDNWKILDTITSSDSLGYKEVGLAQNSKWLKLKVVLDGTEIAIEELQVINTKHK